MTRRLRVYALVLAGLALPACALGQQGPSAPHTGYVYPAGGRQGTTVQVVVGGQFLDGVKLAHFSGTGIQAEVVEHFKPLSIAQFNALREKLKELLDKRAAAANPARGATRPVWTAEDEKMLAEIRKKLATFQGRPATPAIAERVTLKVTIAPDARPGMRDLRLAASGGLTNPLVFCVGQLPEVVRTAVQQQLRTTVDIDLPVVVNGHIAPGVPDRYRFKARKGQRIVAVVTARQLMPYIADAVPGWIQTVLTLYDPSGREIACVDDYRFNPDPVLCYEIPRDGQYVIEIRDALYRGREDFVYRLALGELPFITGIFPLGGKAGEAATIEVRGWNLPTNRLIQNRDVAAGLYPLTVRRDGLLSNTVMMAIDTLPEALEREPNDAPAAAQPVSLPVIINGRIDRPGDWDVFRFQGRAGSAVVIEVFARRLTSPLDSVLKLTDAAGRQIAFNDDWEDKGFGLLTHHADSRISITLPADGEYFVHLGDMQSQGGDEYAYRLRLTEPRPDFELRVVPSSVNMRGGTAPLTVYALRRDGFSGDITLALKEPTRGLTLSGARIPAGADRVAVTISAGPGAPTGLVNVEIEGRATIAGRQVVRRATPAEDMMQAFAYHHLVPVGEMLLSVGRLPSGGPVRVADNQPVRVPAGGTARFHVGMPAKTLFGKVHLELSDAPEGLSIERFESRGPGMEVVVRADPAKAKPGTKGNLIITAFAERSGSGGTARRFPMATLPAIPFEITAR